MSTISIDILQSPEMRAFALREAFEQLIKSPNASLTIAFRHGMDRRAIATFNYELDRKGAIVDEEAGEYLAMTLAEIASMRGTAKFLGQVNPFILFGDNKVMWREFFDGATRKPAAEAIRFLLSKPPVKRNVGGEMLNICGVTGAPFPTLRHHQDQNHRWHGWDEHSFLANFAEAFARSEEIDFMRYGDQFIRRVMEDCFDDKYLSENIVFHARVIQFVDNFYQQELTDHNWKTTDFDLDEVNFGAFADLFNTEMIDKDGTKSTYSPMVLLGGFFQRRSYGPAHLFHIDLRTKAFLAMVMCAANKIFDKDRNTHVTLNQLEQFLENGDSIPLNLDDEIRAVIFMVYKKRFLSLLELPESPAKDAAIEKLNEAAAILNRRLAWKFPDGVVDLYVPNEGLGLGHTFAAE